MCTAHCSNNDLCGGAGEVCNMIKGGCYLPCGSDEDCTSGQTCDTSLCQSVNEMSCKASAFESVSLV